MFATLAAAFLLGHVATVILFALISFWALREFITITPTRPGDHRRWSGCPSFSPLQFVLVGRLVWASTAFSSRSTPSSCAGQIALAGDPKRFLERTAKIQWGLLICVYCLAMPRPC